MSYQTQRLTYQRITPAETNSGTLGQASKRVDQGGIPTDPFITPASDPSSEEDICPPLSRSIHGDENQWTDSTPKEDPIAEPLILENNELFLSPPPVPTWRENVERCQQELQGQLESQLREMGYMPPAPPPFLETRVFETIADEMYDHIRDPEVAETISLLKDEIISRYGASYGFLEQIRVSLAAKVSLFSYATARLQGWDRIINDASLSIHIPDVAPSLKENMLKIEHFLAEPWRDEERRGVLAIHVDQENQQTILQIGIAEYGAIYITLPKVIRPEDIALKSIRTLLTRIDPFREVTDPMAVIDGDKSYHQLNFSEIFMKSRVIRAPSGNISLLANNLTTTAKRERLSTQNTVIFNATPATQGEYENMDLSRQTWPLWRDEAQGWNATVARTQFASAPEASSEAFLAALTHAQNVIVIVAHCDGQKLFMPAPPPTGSQISTEYLREHQAQIAANRPFVYLFACEAAIFTDVESFASTLLDCGVAGVVASQTTLPNDEGRPFLGRLLDERRVSPPIEDFWQAMQETAFFKMEVFLA